MVYGLHTITETHHQLTPPPTGFFMGGPGELQEIDPQSKDRSRRSEVSAKFVIMLLNKSSNRATVSVVVQRATRARVADKRWKISGKININGIEEYFSGVYSPLHRRGQFVTQGRVENWFHSPAPRKTEGFTLQNEREII